MSVEQRRSVAFAEDDNVVRGLNDPSLNPEVHRPAKV
jgi:hypothetical protein